MPRPWARLWPRTLRVRLFLILLGGLTIAYGLCFAVLGAERTISARAVMLGTLESDVATSVAVLDRVPADERPGVAELLSRDTYRFVLGPGSPGVSEISARGHQIAARIGDAIGQRIPLRVESIPGGAEHLQAHLTLSDGKPLTIDVTPHGIMPMARWLPYILAVQLALVIFCTWLAVRQAIRPLGDLAAAADAIRPGQEVAPFREVGPREVAHAARAFNAMRDRIAQHLQERVQILASISHDLQTPITRMRLRADLAEDSSDKEKLVHDLLEIERLVQDGIAYARSAHDGGEKSARIDLVSFVDSIACDYQDTGKAVAISSLAHAVVETQPRALRRILSNLIDNALKFSGAAEIGMQRLASSRIAITVSDRGPGIPGDMLEAVKQPFVRLEQSRSRDTGGTGLGLAIAQQLATSLGGSMRLSNRDGGGLMAEIILGDRGD